MKLKDLIDMYEEKKKEFGSEAYRHISELLANAKEIHKKDFDKHPTPQGNHQQSWNSFKGHNLEGLITHIIEDEVNSLGLKLVRGDKLERTKSENLDYELSLVKQHLWVDFGEFGAQLPDLDIVVYDPKTCSIMAVISSKVTLRERIAQTGYWKIKLFNNKPTKHIRVFFFTLDEDETMTKKIPTKKGRAIVEVDTDGGYVMSETQVEESSKVKMFDKFIDDLKELVNANK
jgi:type II restriction enzyme